MSFGERNSWIYLAVCLISYGIYLAVILGRSQGVPLAEVPYVAPMLWTIGIAIAAMIVLVIIFSIAAGISAPKECGKTDQRDREIHRFGEYLGLWFVVFGGAAALGMSMAEMDHFWISNELYLAFVLSSVVGSAAKIVAYRRGFQAW